MLSLIGFGWAQSVEVEDSDKIDVYFLVDASGSMKENKSDAESKLAAAFELLDPGTQVSVTFFGAKDTINNKPVKCEHQVVISKRQSSDIGAPNYPELGGSEDETSIGAALKAVLVQGSAYPKIVILTDGVEECDSDFARIRRHFPRATIDVIQVGNRQNTALNLLEISSKNIITTTELQSPLPIKIISDIAAPDERPSLFLFIEKWTWLFGFILIYIFLFWFGWSNQSRAIKIEGDTDNIKSLERASLVEGNKKAQESLATIIKDIRDQRETEKNRENERVKWTKQFVGLWRALDSIVPPWQLTSSIAIAIFMFWIAATDVKTVSSVDIGNLRSSAWAVLDSDFATAFAVIWIMSLFYGGSQVQRRKEAETNYSIASREAEWNEDNENQKKIKAQNKKLQAKQQSALKEARKSLNQLKFGQWRTYIAEKSEEPNYTDYEVSSRFKSTCKVAKQRVSEEEELELEEYTSETQRLNRYCAVSDLSSSSFGFAKKDFREFLNAMLEDEKVAPRLSQNWSRMAQAMAKSDLTEFVSALNLIEEEES